MTALKAIQGLQPELYKQSIGIHLKTQATG